MLERLVATFGSTFLASLIAAGHYGLSDLRAAGLAAIAAALVVAKAGVARLLGSKSASLLGITSPSS